MAMKLQTRTLPELLQVPAVKERFNEVLNRNAANFVQTLLTLYNTNEELRKCEPMSILAAAGVAATLNLSISPSLGHAYIIPYKGKATFQIGFKGLVQLAHRTGRYVALNSAAVYEGQIRSVNPITGELITGDKLSDTIVGYVAYMKLVNGFEKALYMTREEIETHAMLYSQTYKLDQVKNWKNSTWSKQFDRMAIKTVLKLLLNRWGDLSSDLYTAIQADQSVVTKTTFTYVDNDARTVQREKLIEPEVATVIEGVDNETGEVMRLGELDEDEPEEEPE